MIFAHRPMQPEDVPECVKMMAAHPVFGPRYGREVEILPKAWLRLLQSEAQITAVFRAGEGPRTTIVGAGVTSIVRDDFLSDLKTPPHFWIGPELARRIVNGESPLLTGRQLRDDNAHGGLNAVCWEACTRAGYEADVDLHRYILKAFIQDHQGYFWKEVIGSPAGPDHLKWLLNGGGFLWDPLAGGYTCTLRTDPGEIAAKPHVIGVTRDLEFNRRQGDWVGSWVGASFDYRPPILCFSRSEQRLLSRALSGATDEHLAQIQGASLPTVKKTWVSIYRRVEDSLPGLIPDSLRPALSANGRGTEKRRRLLAYLREHPEELRPVSRKLLSKAQRPGSAAPSKRGTRWHQPRGASAFARVP